MRPHRTAWILAAALLTLAAPGCSDDDDDGVLEVPTGLSGQWIVTPNLGRLNPCYFGLLFLDEPVQIAQNGAEATLRAIDSAGDCREIPLTASDDTLTFDDELTLHCSGAGGPPCDVVGRVTIEMSFTDGTFTGTSSGTMEAVPGSGCQFQTFNFTREIAGERCSGCWPGCTP